MNIHSFIKTRILVPYANRKLCSAKKDFQKSIQVCILGAHTYLGRLTSFLMKQNPIISVLKIHGEAAVHNMTIDLEQIDMKCKVQPFYGDSNVSKAIRGADIVIILGKGNLKEDTPLADRILEEGRRVYELAKECTVYAPRSLIVVTVSPVSVMTPLVANVFKETNWYHPGRIIGSSAVAQVKANTLAGRYQDLDPRISQVPILGGPDIDLAVPLFSRAKPMEITDNAAERIMEKFRGLKTGEFPKIMCREDFLEDCPLSEAFALNNMISTIGLGICGAGNAHYNAFVRSNAISTCQHLVTTLKFSRGGVVHNYGVPELTRLELKVFEKAVLQIKEREKMAEELLEYLEKGKSSLPPFKIKDIVKKKMLQQTVIRA